MHVVSICIYPLDLLHEPDPKFRRNYDIDAQGISAMFDKYDKNKDGFIDYEEL